MICVGEVGPLPGDAGSTIRYLSRGASSGYSDWWVSWTKGDGGGRSRRYTWNNELAGKGRWQVSVAMAMSALSRLKVW